MSRLEKYCRGSKSPSRRAATVAAMMLTVLLTSCQTMGTVAIESACLTFQPVSWSKNDTLTTIRQIREHNAVWKSLCQNSEFVR